MLPASAEPGWDVGMQPSDSLKTAKQALKGEQLNPDVLQCPTCRCQLEGVYNSLGSVYLYSSGAEGPFDGGLGVAVRMRSALGTATGLGRLCPHRPLPRGDLRCTAPSLCVRLCWAGAWE